MCEFFKSITFTCKNTLYTHIKQRRKCQFKCPTRPIGHNNVLR